MSKSQFLRYPVSILDIDVQCLYILMLCLMSYMSRCPTSQRLWAETNKTFIQVTTHVFIHAPLIIQTTRKVQQVKSSPNEHIYTFVLYTHKYTNTQDSHTYVHTRTLYVYVHTLNRHTQVQCIRMHTHIHVSTRRHMHARTHAQKKDTHHVSHGWLT